MQNPSSILENETLKPLWILTYKRITLSQLDDQNLS